MGEQRNFSQVMIGLTRALSELLYEVGYAAQSHFAAHGLNAPRNEQVFDDDVWATFIGLGDLLDTNGFEELRELRGKFK
ncbi:MAG: hypothetical protein AAFQ79_18950 [Pseudomonadota bacterium]